MLKILLSSILIAVIRLYRMTIGLVLPASCRYSPSCSAYAIESVKVHGPWHGLRLSVFRILRCHPFHPGGYDPVPGLKTKEGNNF